MKQLTIEEEGLVDLNSYDIACEGLFDFVKSKEENSNTFDTAQVFEKVRQYSKNPQNFTLSTKPVKAKLCISLNGAAPATATEMAIHLEKTLKQVFTVASKLEKDRLSQALILGATINTFNLNIGSNTHDSKVAKVVVQAVMKRVVTDARRAQDSYYQWVGRAVQEEAASWLGGNPFNLKLKPETGRYRNAGGGKLKSVGSPLIADKVGIDKLVKIFLQNTDQRAGTFKHSALDDREFKHYVEYTIDPELKQIGPLDKTQRQALSAVFSGKSNSQTLQYELCGAMKSLYVSLLVYFDTVIVKKKE